MGIGRKKVEKWDYSALVVRLLFFRFAGQWALRWPITPDRLSDDSDENGDLCEPQ